MKGDGMAHDSLEFGGRQVRGRISRDDQPLGGRERLHHALEQVHRAQLLEQRRDQNFIRGIEIAVDPLERMRPLAAIDVQRRTGLVKLWLAHLLPGNESAHHGGNREGDRKMRSKYDQQVPPVEGERGRSVRPRFRLGRRRIFFVWHAWS
ncbi:MAG TPA: hypothetical protein VHE61_01315 [Opitutaceae bacterium]|nr:hypothetical protein [Opitutaceae bacterium]